MAVPVPVAEAEERRKRQRKAKPQRDLDLPLSPSVDIGGKTKATTKIRAAPPVTSEYAEGGLWCCAPCPCPCPSPVALNRNFKNLHLRRRTRKTKKKAAEAETQTPTTPTEPAVAVQSVPQGNCDDESPSAAAALSFDDADSGDVRVFLHGSNGAALKLSLHRCVLVHCSGLFRGKLSSQNGEEKRCQEVEITECGDVEMFVEALRLMYVNYSEPRLDLKRRLMRLSVLRVLRVLQICATVSFEAGIVACLEHLEKVPWSEEEEEILVTMLKHPRLRSIIVAARASSGQQQAVLDRLQHDDGTAESGMDGEAILEHLVEEVMKAEQEMARRQTKALVGRMLMLLGDHGHVHAHRAEATLYDACRTSLRHLKEALQHSDSHSSAYNGNSDGNNGNGKGVTRIADNLHWLLEVLAGMRAAEDLVGMWARDAELARARRAASASTRRHEVSRVTAAACVAIARGQVAADAETRALLVATWLEALMEDFAWLRRSGCQLDTGAVAEALGSTVLTLPLPAQRAALLCWLRYYLRDSSATPDLSRAFQVWWRRSFLTPALRPA